MKRSDMRMVLVAFTLLAAGCAQDTGTRGSRTAEGSPSSRPAEGPTTTRVQARLHQLKSSKGRPYSLFEYSVPTKDAVPHIIAIDHKDEVWFSESGGRFARNFIDVPAMNKVARLDKYGSITEWTTGPEASSPMGIAFDPSGDLWVVERLTDRVSRRHKDGRVTRYDLPTKKSWPTGIAIDAKGNVWVTETMGDKIARIDAATGVVREFPFGKKGVRATGIAVDAQNQVWIAMRDLGKIGRFDPASEQLTEFALPTPDARPCGVLVDRQGQVWFSERNGGKIGRILSDGTIQEFATDDRHGGPFLLVDDKRGDIWFTEIFSGRVGRFEPASKTFEYFKLPDAKALPAGLAVDSKGNVWVAQQASNLVGVIVRTDLGYISGDKPGAARTAKLEALEHEIVELDVPTPQAIPGIVAVDQQDTVWFTEMGGGWVSPGFPPGPGGSRIGYVKDGKIHELSTPTPESGPTSMALDPCGGDVWVTLRAANKLAQIRDFKVVEHAIPVANGLPVGVTVDMDHNVWVALSDANKIGRRTPEGQWRFLELDQPNSEPRTVFVDKRDQVWFAEKTGNRIGLIDKKAWTAKTWKIPTRVAWPLSLVEDKHGNIWFAQMRSDKLAYLDPRSGKITEFELPVQSAPFKLSYEESTATMWISTVFYNAILKFDINQGRVVSVFKVPSEGAWIGGLDRDSRGCLWFTEQFANKVARLCVGKKDELARTSAALPRPPAEPRLAAACKVGGVRAASTP